MNITKHICLQCGQLATMPARGDVHLRPPCPKCRGPLCRVIPDERVHRVKVELADGWHLVDAHLVGMDEYHRLIASATRDPRVASWRVVEETQSGDRMNITIKGPRIRPEDAEDRKPEPLSASSLSFSPPDPRDRMLFGNALVERPLVRVRRGDAIAMEQDDLFYLANAGGDHGIWSATTGRWQLGGVEIVEELAVRRTERLSAFFSQLLEERGRLAIYDTIFDEIIVPSKLIAKDTVQA